MTNTATNPTPPPSSQATTAWLDQLYGTAEAGWLTLFSLDRTTGNRHTDWAPATDTHQLAQAAHHREPTSCVWFGVALRNQRLDGGRRGGSTDCTTIPGLWVDIDIEGPGHKGGHPLAPNRQAATQLLDNFPLPPTAIVDTGGGIQAWWLFNELTDLDDTTRQLLDAWGATWNRIGTDAGIYVDNVFDPARVMRLPGTTNRKDGLARPVTITTADWSQRYGLDDIDQHLDPPPPPLEHTIGTGIAIPYIGPERPGDAYNARHTGSELLAAAGFTLARRDRSGEEHWVRPGKDAREGHSATVYLDDGHTTIWSDTCTAQWPNLEVRRPYDPFGLYTVIHHAGDHSAATKTLRAAGYGTPPAPRGPIQLADNTPANPTAAELPAGTTDAIPDAPWPQPAGLPTPEPLPTWPQGVLPKWIDDQVHNVATSVQCAIDIPATFGLGALAVAALGKLRVEARPGRTESTALYLAAVAGVSEGKTPSVNLMTAPIQAAEDLAVHHAKAAEAEHATRRAVAEDQVKDLRLKAQKLDDTDAMAKAISMAAELEQADPPPTGRMMTSDVTPERLATLMAASGERMSVVSDEAGVLNIDRYGDKRRGSNIDLYLQAWSGARVTIDRQTAPSVILRHPLLNIVVGAQPEAWEKAMVDEEFRTRGLGARFMAVRCTPQAHLRVDDLDRDVWDQDVADEYHRRLEAIANRLASWQRTATITLSDEARTTWATWARQLNGRTIPGGDLDHDIGWASKLKDSVIRVAALLHLADGHDVANGGLIDADTMARACRLGDHWTAHRAGDLVTAGDNTRRLLAALVRLQAAVIHKEGASVARNGARQPPFVARRDLGRRGPVGLRKVDQHQAPLIALLEAGLVRLVGATGGPNTQVTDLIRSAVGIQVHPDASKWLTLATPRDSARQARVENNETHESAEPVAAVAHCPISESPDPLSLSTGTPETAPHGPTPGAHRDSATDTASQPIPPTTPQDADTVSTTWPTDLIDTDAHLEEPS